MRLRESSIARLPNAVRRLRYDRAQLQTGIVHLGPGVFHRAHQAWFTEGALHHNFARDPASLLQWGICAVGLNTPGVPAALAAQDGLFLLYELDGRADAGAAAYQLIGAIRESLHAPTQLDTVLARLMKPQTRVVTLTITEKGYRYDGGFELDIDHPDIRTDLADPEHPKSAVGLLALAFSRRHAAGVAPFLTISCDNLPDNSARLLRAVRRYVAAAHDTPSFPRASRVELDHWLESDARCANTLVDSIAPATTPALMEAIATQLGVEDRAAVHREPFTQWVLQDPGAIARPVWEAAGAQWVRDVRPFEAAKLRVLNGSHSALAYLGLLLGVETVADAMQHAALAQFVLRMQREEVLPSLVHTSELDAPHYLRSVLTRIANPALGHRLRQIAMDGSQKIPVRLLPVLMENLAAGRPTAHLCLAIAAWFCFLREQARAGAALADPAAEPLLALGRACSGDAHADVGRFLTSRSFAFGAVDNAALHAALAIAYARLGNASPAAVSTALRGP